MGDTHFVLSLHNHQPVGNFENVFREAFEKCYDPFLAFLEAHPWMRVSLHYSGCLLDWLEAREGRFLKRLKKRIEEGQVEILGGGYYEPILPLIPERDAVGQMRYMNQYLEERLGARPRGFWLTERVWESKIPRLAAQAGLEFTAVDDAHFSLAGIAESEIKNFFITEEEGHPLYLFPIPKTLRYAIPFHEPEEAVRYLRSLSQEGPAPAVATYADDGEKFGLWPGTYQWVYRDGWLERFARALEENRSWLILKSYREVLDERKDSAVKKVYLPTASYEEMGEWALGLEKAREFASLKREFGSLGAWERVRTFFQGGTFKNFLAKYPEADWMRSRMGRVSRKVGALREGPQKKKAQIELWQAQCNCPYWHGVFGGLYLHHLRRSTYEHLLRAEEVCDSGVKQGKRLGRVLVEEEDFNQDGAREVIVASPPFSFYFLPHRGGALGELDFQPEGINILDTMTRREEAYHREIVRKKSGEGKKGRSIHELEKALSAEVLERVAFDAWDRLSLLEHFLPPQTSPADFWKRRFQLLGPVPTSLPFAFEQKDQKNGTTLTFRGKFRPLDSEGAVAIEKNISIVPNHNEFRIHWRIGNESKAGLECLWGSEWNLNFYEREKQETNCRKIEIQDGWSKVCFKITGEEPFDYWQFPIETVAQTEADFRLIHQGISLFPHWRLSLKPGQNFERTLTFHLSTRTE